MRAQCSICSDLYDGEKDVAAIGDCGHTFHDTCLTKWLNQSMTCPQCRKGIKKKRVIHKLYFNEAEEDEENGISPSKLQNEVSALKAALRQKDQEKINLQEATEVLHEEIKKLKTAKAKIDKAYKAEKTSYLALQKELLGFQQQKEQAAKAISEACQLRNKLDSLTTVQAVIQGLECDVQDMITSRGDVQTLATWCAVLKKELCSKKTECKRYKEQYDRINKENMMRKRDLTDKTRMLTSTREQLKNSEEDLKRAEKDIGSLNKKMAHLEKAVLSPTNTASSFAHRLINESPAPQPLTKKPRLSSPESRAGLRGVDLNMTPDLFPDMDRTRSPATTKQSLLPGMTHVKLSSAAQSKRNSAPHDIIDISNKLPPNMNIFKKNQSGTSSGFMKKGYNGFGGHDKFINSFVRPSTLAKKPVKLSAKMRNLGPAPSLPALSMDGLDS